MATKRIPLEGQAAILRIVAPTETDTSHNDLTDWVGAVSALAQSASLRPAVRYLSYALFAILIGALLLVATATVPMLFGYHNYIVNGSSMGASLPRGSVAVSKPTSPYALEIGDIIAQRSSPDSTPVLHRIVDISVEDGQRLFVTQGDVNRTPDPEPVIFQGLGDRVVYSVPYAGYILNFAGSGLGRPVLIGIPLILLAVNILRDKRPSPQLRTTASAETGAAQELSSRGFTPPATTEKNVPEAASAPLDLPSRSSPTPWRATTQPDRLRPVSEGSAPNGGRRWYDMPGLMPVRLTLALRLDQAERANGAASGQQTEPEGQREEQRVA